MDYAGSIFVVTFAIYIVVVALVYLLPWWFNRTGHPNTGSWMVTGIAGLAGLVMSVWLIRFVLSVPPPREELWGPLIGFLIYSPFPLGAFCISAKFIRQALRDERRPTSMKQSGGSSQERKS